MRNALYILGEFAEEDLLWLARVSSLQVLNAGDQLIQSGVPIRNLYFVAEGELSVQLGDGTVVAVRGVGDVLGEMSFVEKRLPDANVLAAVSTRVVAVPRERLINELSGNPAFAARFYKALAIFLSDRLRTATSQQFGDSTTDMELDEHVLDRVHVAGDRMLRLIQLMEAK